MTREVILLAPSGKEERAERYRLVRKAHEASKRNERRRERAKTAALCLSGMLIVGLGFENLYLARKAEAIHTVYAVIRDDGTLVNSERFTDVATQIQSASNELNSLWTYVWSRECYDSGRVAEHYYIVQTMSSDRVAREFRDWFDKSNPESPQKLYGAKGVTVHCQFSSVMPSGDKDGFEFHYERWESRDSGDSPHVMYVAPLRYRTGVYSSDPRRGWVDATTFNAKGVQVWEYPGAHPEGVSSILKKVAAQ